MQQGDSSCRLEGASLQQLLHMADQQQVSTSHQLALLHSPNPNMPARIVSGLSRTMCYSSRVTLTVTVWTLLTCG